MQQFIYSISGERRIIQNTDVNNYVGKGIWYLTPSEASKAVSKKSSDKAAPKKEPDKTAPNKEKSDESKSKGKVK